jgi:hypothetical protein
MRLKEVNRILPSTIDTPANRRALPDTDPSLWVAPPHLARVLPFPASCEACPW